MTKHTDSSRSTDSGVSGNAQTGAREIRLRNASEWLELQMKVAPFIRESVSSEAGHTTRFSDITCLLAKFAESECSRLASRVEELENVLRNVAVAHTNYRIRLTGEAMCLLTDRILLAEEKLLAGAHAEEKCK